MVSAARLAPLRSVVVGMEAGSFGAHVVAVLALALRRLADLAPVDAHLCPSVLADSFIITSLEVSRRGRSVGRLAGRREAGRREAGQIW